jgi:transcriptional regulator with XRE-family HTH domain
MMFDKPRTTFGERLRSARDSASLSQSQLAKISGIPKPMLSRYENDHILPSVDTLLRLSDSLNLGAGSLLSEESAETDLLQRALHSHGVRIESSEQAELIAVEAARVVDAAGQISAS